MNELPIPLTHDPSILFQRETARATKYKRYSLIKIG